MKIIAAFAVSLALASTLSIAPAQAQATRTFVSPTGNDASATCSLAAPCRTFLAAYALTNAGGEIAVLGTAGYGPLTIGKAISIVNGGGFEAAIAVPSGGIGITINAGTNDAVSLRGLSIEGAGVGSNGIKFNTGKSLTVENCVIRRVTFAGISFVPNASSSLSVSNTVMADNYNGIYVSPTGSAAVIIVLNRVEAKNNSNNGIEMDGNLSTGTVTAAVADSIATGSQTGIVVVTTTGQAPTTMTLVRSVSANNSTGLTAVGPGATLRLANSAVTGNTSRGWILGSGGVLASYGDNYIDGNGANLGSLTTIVRQ